MKVAIIDYGMGNIYSIFQACKKVGIEAEITSTVLDVKKAQGIIIPGVGAFKPAIDKLVSNGMTMAIKDAMNDHKPVLGICLGMQLLAIKSYEHGEHSGLNIVNAEVVKFPSTIDTGKAIKVPNIGWSSVFGDGSFDNELYSIINGRYFYFLHSYYFDCNDSNVIKFYSSNDGFRFCAAISLPNILAVQFHPEKSGDAGLEIFRYYKRMLDKAAINLLRVQ